LEEQSKIKRIPGPSARFYAFLAYIPVVGLCSLFAVDSTEEVAYFHSKQGFLLCVCEFMIPMLGFIPVAGPWILLTTFGFFLFSHLKSVWELYHEKRWLIPGLGKVAVLLEL
jgi:uncharacterized membrane protein